MLYSRSCKVYAELPYALVRIFAAQRLAPVGHRRGGVAFKSPVARGYQPGDQARGFTNTRGASPRAADAHAGGIAVQRRNQAGVGHRAAHGPAGIRHQRYAHCHARGISQPGHRLWRAKPGARHHHRFLYHPGRSIHCGRHHSGGRNDRAGGARHAPAHGASRCARRARDYSQRRHSHRE